MSIIIKVSLLVAVVVCVCAAQEGGTGHKCLCQRVRNHFPRKSEIKGIQIYPADIYCDRVEIVVSTRNSRYCLNPKMSVAKRLLTNIINQRSSSTSRPTEVTSTPVIATSAPSTARN